MQSVLLNLSDNQLSKLHNGHTIQIKPEMVGMGMKFALNNKNIKKLRNAYDKARALRMAFDDEEIEASTTMNGGGFKKFIHKAGRAVHKAKNIAHKVDNVLHDENLDRKILSTSRQIKNSVNKAQVLGDLGIPVVSDVYNGIHGAVNSGDQLVRKGVATKSRIVNDFDDARNEYKTGSGNNPYLAKTTKSGGSFRVLGGSMKKVKLQTDSAINIVPTNPSFHPLKPKTYEEVMHGGSMKKCQYCNH